MPRGNSFPNSAFSHNIGAVDEGHTTGDVFYCDSTLTGASDGNDGRSPASATATLDGANNLCAANNGDVIFVAPNHAETLIADSGVDLDTAGVTVIGIGRGTNRPTFNFTTATTADFKIAAADVKIHNLLLTTGIDSQAMMIETSGDNFEISHCEFRGNATQQMLIAINIGVASNDSDRGFVHDCRIINDTAGATSGISITALQADLRIEDNYVRGDFSDAVLQSAVIHTDCMVRGNYLQNDNNGNHAIQFSTTSTGMILNNDLVTDAIATAMDQGSCFASRNMYYDDSDVDAAGTPVPTTDTTGGTSLASITAQHTVPAQDATANVDMGDVIGNKTDAAQVVVAANRSLVGYQKGLMDSTLRTLVKTDGAVLNGNDDLFTITGGSIHVVSIIGTVTTIIGGVANGTLQAGVTTPAADVAMSTTVAINSDAVGTTYHFTGPTGVLTPTTAGAFIFDYASATITPSQWIVPIGNINFLGSAAQSGVIEWVLTYYMTSNATVVVAA